MRLDMNIFQIAAKYAANLMGIATPEEREALENWNQESVWHTNLAERLDQEEDFKANQQLLERFSVTESWKKMEKNLDKVESGKADWHKTVDDFYQGFAASLEQAEKNMEGKRIKVEDIPTDEICEKCGRVDDVDVVLPETLVTGEMPGEVRSWALTFYGICRCCAADDNKNNKEKN